ncbi:type II toxin-antitoxin system Phd/YefM family antitoxin [uncultured Helicobacter sp.]|uniref:type II toxin-antitoxin system Phd/YefM family antitoxin n=1 Tax=uncultured Helicobacter sp. TaxID=175537 RepID=UPI002627B492|nr:type II toxin-antitoxin system Phd/YefM family antitoxin [uncultured Helicobacter sp.]
MQNVNITNFQKNILSLFEETIKYNQPLQIHTESGNAILISEEDYNSLLETLHLYNNPTMREKIVNGLNTPLNECIREEEVDW